jgi:hypothetical protein
MAQQDHACVLQIRGRGRKIAFFRDLFVMTPVRAYLSNEKE